MTDKRKAELQRKLSMSAVPSPPEDLAKRIKAQIPDLLSVRPERERLSTSIAFSMRVAASIILLVTSVALSIHLMSRNELSEAIAVPRSETKGAPAAVTPAFADTAEITVTLASEGDRAAAGEFQKEQPGRADVRLQSSSKKDEAQDKNEVLQGKLSRDVAVQVAEEESRSAVGSTFGVVGGAVGNVVADAAASPPAAPAPALSLPAPPPPPPAPVASVAAPEESIDTSAQSVPAAAAMTERRAMVARRETRELAKARANTAYETARSIFGFSVDPAEFGRLRSIIEGGRKPAADRIDVEALVNHFAGTAASGRAPVRLQVEGSRLPVRTDDGVAILRFTVDTRSAADPVAAPDPVATDARIEVILNRNAILRHRLVGDARDLAASEGTLLRGSSVTALVELRLKPGLSPSQEIATVRLTYRSASDGRLKTLEETVRARDFDRSWTVASRRHRRATLGALWGESLRAEATADDVARAAADLADEAPGDDRARDLAAAATASSRLRSSAPTGSGR